MIGDVSMKNINKVIALLGTSLLTTLFSCTDKTPGNTNSDDTAILTNEIKDVPLTVQLSESSFDCFVGDSGSIAVSILPSTANQSVIWSSSNNSVIEIYNGTWYANTVGSATLIATAIKESKVYAVLM